MKKYKYAMEIGCGDRYSSELFEKAMEIDRVVLIEPNEIFLNSFRSTQTLMSHPNLRIYNYAVGRKTGREFLYNFGYCSFLQSAPSFLRLSCEDNCYDFWGMFAKTVETKKMSEIDDGTIDYLVLTCHGSELFVLEDMKSRPKVIRTKYYCHNAKHWEYYNKITEWMIKNGYEGNLLEKNQYGTYMHIEFIKK